MDRGGRGGFRGGRGVAGRGGAGMGGGAGRGRGGGKNKLADGTDNRTSYQMWVEAPNDHRCPSEVQVFIQGLPREMTEEDVVEFVEKKGFGGKIKKDRTTEKYRVHVYRNKANVSKGEATVTFRESKDQKVAIDQLNGIMLQHGDGCYPLTVTAAIVKKHQAAPPAKDKLGQGGRGNARGRGRGGQGGGGPMKGRGHGKPRYDPYPGANGGQRGGHHGRGQGHAGMQGGPPTLPPQGGYQGAMPYQPVMAHQPPHGPPPRHPYHAGPPGPYYGGGPMGPRHGPPPHMSGHGPPLPHGPPPHGYPMHYGGPPPRMPPHMSFLPTN